MSNGRSTDERPSLGANVITIEIDLGLGRYRLGALGESYECMMTRFGATNDVERALAAMPADSGR